MKRKRSLEMKKVLLISLFVFLAMGVWAQDGKKARKNTREGNKAFKEQLYGKAAGKYAEALTADPTSKEAKYNLATTYYKQQSWDEALKEYESYLSVEKENALNVSKVWSNIGNLYLRKEGDKPAQRRAKQYDQQDQQDDTILQQDYKGQQGQPAQQQGKDEDYLKMSIEAYKNSLRINPQDDATRYNLAVAQKMLKDRQKEGGGGGDDQKQDQDKKDQNQDQQQQQNQNQNQQEQQQGQMSKENIQQILDAMEQEEKQTQERVQQLKQRQRQRQNQENRRQDKDW